MRSFEYLKPRTVEEACVLLSKYRGEAKLLAGGTEMIVKMKQRIESPKYLVDLKGVSGLDKIQYDGDGVLKIGSLVTLRAIETSPVVKEKFSILGQSASKVGSLQLRHRGSIGGNICLDSRCPHFNQSHQWRKSFPSCFKVGGEVCHEASGGDRCFAVCSADTVPALIALGAKVRIISSEAQKIIPLEGFYRRDGDGRSINTLGGNEIVTHIEIPTPPTHSAGVYLKVSIRKAVDFPIVGVAVVVELEETKLCRDVRIVLGAISPNPVRAGEAEEVLRGKEVGEELIQEASQSAVKAAHPLSIVGGLAGYRRRVTPVMVERAIGQAMEAARAIQGEGA